MYCLEKPDFMKFIFTLALLCIMPLAYSQSKMTTPTKVVTINNEGNPIKPIQKKNVRKLDNSQIQIKRSELKNMPKKKRKLILNQPEKYIIIED